MASKAAFLADAIALPTPLNFLGGGNADECGVPAHGATFELPGE
jgi:hypothetical protein